VISPTKISPLILKLNKIQWYCVAGVVILLLSAPNAISQQHFSIQVGMGLGKIQYYDNYHPVFFSGQLDEDLKYSPSWNIMMKSTWALSKQFYFSLALSHLTITSTHESVVPAWAGPNENQLTQGFIHILPAISILTPSKRFQYSSGIRIGSANPIGDARARESSHTLGSLHLDIAISNEFKYKLNNSYYFGIDWIEGLTYYEYYKDVIIGTNEIYVSFFKYRSFQLTFEYEINSK